MSTKFCINTYYAIVGYNTAVSLYLPTTSNMAAARFLRYSQ